MLLMLHLAAINDVQQWWSRAFMIAHFGLFILWQPFLRSEQRLSGVHLLAIGCVCVVLMLMLNWWLMLLWIAGLAGILGGKVFQFEARWLKVFHLMALAYLVILLLVWVVPHVVGAGTLPEFLAALVRVWLPAILFAVMAVLPLERAAAQQPQVVDFFYSIFVSLLLVVLVLGSLAFMTLGNEQYLPALAQTMLAIALTLLVLSWIWNPRAGFSGLGMIFSRYLLSVGLPFEQWLHYLAELSQREADPQRFLDEAFASMSKLPLLLGGTWKSPDGSGEFGKQAPTQAEFHDPQLSITLYTGFRLSPTLVWHFNLLTQLLREFYIAKIRERKLKQQSYVQAVHQTGARLTHDVKNILQSLNTLCSAADRDGGAESPELTALMRRQLPQISQRLAQSLDKLKRPQHENGQFILSSAWWKNLQRNYQHARVEFTPAALERDQPIPKGLFDSVADNLLQNALQKRGVQPELRVVASLSLDNGVEFTVCDDGAAVPGAMLRDLLRGPVPSESGLGIGLFQAAEQAQAQGHSLLLRANREGQVCFALVASPQALQTEQTGDNNKT
jgi:signal transduction histidine kinase